MIGAALATGRAADAVGLHLAGDQLAELVADPADLGTAARPRRRALAGQAWPAPRPVRRTGPGFLVGALLYPHLRDAVAMVQDGYATRGRRGHGDDAGLRLPARPDAAARRGRAGPGAGGADGRCTRRYGDPAFAPSPLLRRARRPAGLAFRVSHGHEPAQGPPPAC